MSIRDLMIYADKEQEFIILAESNPFSDPIFKGKLEDCPIMLIDELVYQFKAVDFNTVQVTLCI